MSDQQAQQIIIQGCVSGQPLDGQHKPQTIGSPDGDKIDNNEPVTVDPAEVVEQGVSVDAGKGANAEGKSERIDNTKTEQIKVQVIDATSFKPIFLNGARNVQTILE